MNLPTSQISSVTTDSISQAATWVQSGRLLAYPTESVWGIGCDPFNEVAVRQLLAIKQRSIDKGMIVVTDSAERIKPLLETLNDNQRQAILNSWDSSLHTTNQQAHTWLLPLPSSLSKPSNKLIIPTWIAGAHTSVAVRVIAHPLIQQLCAHLVSAHNPYGLLVSTSCNPSGQTPALSLVQAQTYFATGTDAERVTYLSGHTLGYQLPSQIHDALTGQLIR
ncbi:Sua5/YciO/YrdC/YwlC family protein [Psychrobacter sp. GP33]|uniref:Sua5/YciO/YrdC/YwlC family protein n=1 Tax=Psychrobacter sp. GP33 TaxID=2758709 RepID=UPI0015FE0D12|nr:Sua5/YciO/YrdC/YwlC family protein [Psychrobacter sp. GP33]